MNGPNPHQWDNFDRLLDAMPRIADAVNMFASEDNQNTALNVLVRSLGIVDQSPTTAAAAEPNLSVVPPLPQDMQEDDSSSEATADETVPQSATRKARARKSAVKKTYPRAKDINFRPDGKISLRDFAAEKQPTNFHEKNLVIVYYLEEFLEISSVEVGHVLAAYDECSWKSPSIPDNSLMVTSSQRRWLDTSDMKAIRTTHGGRNAVTYDMPIKKDKKSA